MSVLDEGIAAVTPPEIDEERAQARTKFFEASTARPSWGAFRRFAKREGISGGGFGPAKAPR